MLGATLTIKNKKGSKEMIKNIKLIHRIKMTFGSKDKERMIRFKIG
jgi:hypothetical protein